MKVAKLEIKIIVAMFVAGYEFDIVDSQGKFPKAVPNPNFNDIHQACRFISLCVILLTLSVGTSHW